MPIRVRHQEVEQLQLYERPPNRPRWRDLPTETRSEVRKLIAQMLRAHAVGAAPDQNAEVRDD